MKHDTDTSTLLHDDRTTPVGSPRISYSFDHRKRLRDRFLNSGIDAIPDYEILELILFRAMPGDDVMPLAHTLIARFGDINRIMSASLADILKVPGTTHDVATELKIVEAAAHRLARAKIIGRHVVSSWRALLDYCHTVMAHRDTEQFRILFLDTQNILIADELLAKGTVDHVPVYPREVVKRALDLNASALILVHNHPSGDPTPSDSDINMTNQIVRAADALNITVHDHLIIGKSKEVSFKSLGLL